MEFRRYVKPTEKPILSTFCKELTGIDQAWASVKLLPFEWSKTGYLLVNLDFFRFWLIFLEI